MLAMLSSLAAAPCAQHVDQSIVHVCAMHAMDGSINSANTRAACSTLSEVQNCFRFLQVQLYPFNPLVIRSFP